jgi:hypothetical protein
VRKELFWSILYGKQIPPKKKILSGLHGEPKDLRAMANKSSYKKEHISSQGFMVNQTKHIIILKKCKSNFSKKTNLVKKKANLVKKKNTNQITQISLKFSGLHGQPEPLGRQSQVLPVVVFAVCARLGEPDWMYYCKDLARVGGPELGKNLTNP